MPRFRMPNLRHQQEEFDQFRFAKARALLWQMRTGKSKACIDLACDLYERGEIDRVLVFAPNNVHIAWVTDQWPKHVWLDIPTQAMFWHATSASKDEYSARLDRLIKCKEGLSLLTVNSEGCFYPNPKKIVERFVCGAKKGVLFIADESQDFKRAGSKRGRFARSVAKQCTYKRILTGSGFDNSPLNAWGQFEILQPGALGFKTYGAFEAEYATKSPRRMGNRQFLVVDGYKHLDVLRESIGKWSSVVLRQDVDDMPELHMSKVPFELSSIQQGVYDKLAAGIIDEEPKDGFSIGKAFQGGVKGIKLLQVTSGFYVDEVYEETWFPENPRLEALKEIVTNIEGKFIVWCRFVNDILEVSKALRELDVGFVQFYGLIKSTDREKNRLKFMNDPECRAFVGNPKAGGRGLNLSAASTIIWYSRDYDLEFKRQADERATHVGGKDISVIDILANGTVDISIIKSLEEKTSISEQIDRTGLREFLQGQTLEFEQALRL